MKIQAAENKNAIIGEMVVGGVTNKTHEAATPMGAILKLIRVKHWVKNLFLFIPSFFAGHLFKTQELLMVGIGALACFVF